MKNYLFTLFIFILSFNCYSQVKFEKGFFINNDDQKTECLIKNMDWLDNPTEFKMKLSENNEVKTISVDNIKELTIYNISKYIKKNVKIDKSSSNLQQLSHNKNPVFTDELLMLKVLVEGKASLYYYESENLKRFFFKINDNKIEQLVFKSYLLADNSSKKNNNYFRQQLWNNLKCKDILITDVKDIDYKQKDLVNLFIDYNKCSNSEVVSFYGKKQKDLFNLSIRPRINNSSVNLQHTSSIYGDINFDDKLNFGIGIEAEYILPFNKNKWSIIAEPTFHDYKAELTTETKNVSGGELTVNLDYKSIDIPIGFRYYFFLNENSKIFTDFSYLINFNLNSSFELSRMDGSNLDTLNIRTSNNVAVGLGYNFSDKYSIELRYHSKRNLLNNNISWNSEYENLSIVMGYSFF